jgi:hypothetical protein
MRWGEHANPRSEPADVPTFGNGMPTSSSSSGCVLCRPAPPATQANSEIGKSPTDPAIKNNLENRSGADRWYRGRSTVKNDFAKYGKL